MAAALNLFDVEIDLKELTRGAQHAQSLTQNFRPDSVAGQGYD